MSTDPTPDRLTSLAEIVERFHTARLVVVGDVIADEFVDGEIARVSREAPVMILKYQSTRTIPGGGGNAAANGAALGGSVAIVSRIGRDRAGRSVTLALREAGVDTSGISSLRGEATPTKTRIHAGLPHSIHQQVIRIDREPSAPDAASAESLARRLDVALASADVCIVSDYGYGVAEGPVADVLIAAAARGVRTIVDSRYRLRRFAGATAATPNEAELEELVGAPIQSDAEVVEAANRVAQEMGLEAMLVTRGSRGVLLIERDRDPLLLAIVGSAQAVDVTGAGDTVIAAFALALAAGASYGDAARLANHAGGLVVMKRGTATVSNAELAEAVREGRVGFAYREHRGTEGTKP